MQKTLKLLIEKIENPVLKDTDLITWAAPIPSFGNIKNSSVATLGINPSNREYVDLSGNELTGYSRRFHTLNSLELTDWKQVKDSHLDLILESCNEYFNVNPYHGWFKALNDLISGTKTSFYNDLRPACHLDLIPYATFSKWTNLSLKQRNALLDHSGVSLGWLIAESSIKTLVLNGQSVINNFEKLSGITLAKEVIPTWSLKRKSSKDVLGISYKGIINTVAGVKLPSEVFVIGFNHNLQSSFGITSAVKSEITNWITKSTQERQ